MAIRRYLSAVPLAAVVLACTAAVAIAAKSQTITVESTPPSPAYVGATYHVQAMASSGLAVSVNTEETSSICTLSGSTVTFIAAGTCQVDFNQAGNSEWEKAHEEKQFIEVTKRPQTVTFTSTKPTEATVGGATYTVTATGGESGEPVVLTI